MFFVPVFCCFVVVRGRGENNSVSIAVEGIRSV